MSDQVTQAVPNTPSKKLFLKVLKQLLECNKTIAEITSAAAEARGVKRGILKAFEGSGGDKPAMAMLEALSKLDDDERVDMLRNLAMYAGWADVPLYVPGSEAVPQGALFGDDDQETRDAKSALNASKIYEAGASTQRSGGSREDNPHTAGSEDYTTWDLGWLEGAEAADKAGAPKVASTARKPRGKAAASALN